MFLIIARTRCISLMRVTSLRGHLRVIATGNIVSKEETSTLPARDLNLIPLVPETNAFPFDQLAVPQRKANLKKG